jgi:hypothetical protein
MPRDRGGRREGRDGRDRRGRLGTRAIATLALLLSISTSAACEGPAIVTHGVVVGPLDRFEVAVEPVLEQRCAQGGCHGRADRPFTLYAPGAYRADPSRVNLAEPLEAEELATNALRVAALASSTDPEASLVLRKPLALSAGGLHHGGGDVFVDRTDRDYRAIRDWLASCAPAEGGI